MDMDMDQQQSNMVFPMEIFIQIINKIKPNSYQFLLDYLNIIDAINNINNSILNKQIITYLIDNFNKKCDIIDLSGSINNNTPMQYPLISKLLHFFPIKNCSSDHKKEKIIFIINDSFLINYNTFQKFNDFLFPPEKSKEQSIIKFHHQSYCNIPFDIIYIPSLQNYTYKNNNNNTTIDTGYMFRPLSKTEDDKLSTPDLMKCISFFPPYFNLDNLILDFNSNKLLLPKDLFGIYSPNFFIFNDENNNSSHCKWLKPRCNQITFHGVSHLKLDYMAMDEFISNLFNSYATSYSYSSSSSSFTLFDSPYDSSFYLHNRSYDSSSSSYVKRKTHKNTIAPIQYLFSTFLNNVNFFAPTLTELTFHNINSPNATCNFIDLSTNFLKKLSDNKTTILSYLQMHSLLNWNLPNLYHFGGQRFKFHTSTNSNSKQQINENLLQNITSLSNMIKNETIDGVPYLRISLIPSSAKKSKILNWLPILSSNQINTSNEVRSTSPTRISIKNEPKPILCLKSNSLQTLELRVLECNNTTNNYHIQGLFLPNLTKLILQNFQFNINSPSIISSDYTTTTTTPQHNNNNPSDTMFNNGLNLYPTGFSEWNDLNNCQIINLADNIKESDQQSSYQIHLVFNIQNLKKIMPNLNLKESFYTFVDERQQYIVV